MWERRRGCKGGRKMQSDWSAEIKQKSKKMLIVAPFSLRTAKNKPRESEEIRFGKR